MTLSAHDQRELADIEHRLSGSDPGLALLLATFTRLNAGEEMPLRERIRAGWQRLNWDRMWLLLALLVGLALIAVSAVAAVSGGRAACSASAAACGRRAGAAPMAIHSRRWR